MHESIVMIVFGIIISQTKINTNKAGWLIALFGVILFIVQRILI